MKTAPSQHPCSRHLAIQVAGGRCANVFQVGGALGRKLRSGSAESIHWPLRELRAQQALLGSGPTWLQLLRSPANRAGRRQPRLTGDWPLAHGGGLAFTHGVPYLTLATVSRYVDTRG
jgi:hypothetical protein